MTTDTQPEPLLWLVRQGFGDLGGWWVTEGEWKPGHPELVKGRFASMEDALQAARDHNARLGKRGRPAVPLSVDTVWAAMERSEWNVTAAAKLLGVSRSTLKGWLKARSAEVAKKPRFSAHPARKQRRTRSKK